MNTKMSERIISVLSGLSRTEVFRCLDMAQRMERLGISQEKADSAVEAFVGSGVYLRGVR